VWNAELTGDSHAWVKLGELTGSFESPNPLASSAQSAGEANRVLAPMTGVIRVVHAKEGDAVLEGDPLVVLEAMKMETTLSAPRDGVIDAIQCAPNDSVSDGDVLIQLVLKDEDT